MASNQLDRDFEDEVRRIARAKWPHAQYAGAAMLDGKERDGIFETEESTNFIEATVSQSAGKAKEDSKKLFKAVADHNRTATFKPGIGWFITKNDPTADQRKEVQEYGKGQVRAVSFAQFQQSLIDVRAYLAARNAHGFGSVQDFVSGAKKPSVDFVEIGLSETTANASMLVADVIEGLLKKQHFVLVGQYGAGKSMTMREIYLRLAERYALKKSSTFPLYINLREHSGQREPVEILERHARNIGFESPSSLVRAWRAGFAIIIADGFDEVTSLGVQGSWKKLRELRRRSLEGLRGLVRDSVESGVIVGGRIHYFESDDELYNVLGLKTARTLSVDEFDSVQINTFLSKFSEKNTGTKIPEWLPTRPLLLGYLASRDLLSGLQENVNIPDAVDGWDYLLSQIYEREERIETNLDGATLRRILERAATIARSSEDRLGPISRRDLFSAFSEVCQYEPDEQGVLAIQRLPGLGIYSAEDESRCFVDKELADVCNGHELLRLIVSPYEAAKEPMWVEVMNNCEQAIGDLSVELVVRRLKASENAYGNLQQTIAFLNKRSDLPCARGDVAAVAISSGLEINLPLVVREISFRDVKMEFGETTQDLSQLSFAYCQFEYVYLDSAVKDLQIPYFDNCIFEKIEGRISVADLPKDRFADSCTYANFNKSETSDAIRGTELTVGEKVLLVTMRKLFVQSLSGRTVGALYRGLDVDERRYVIDILRLLSKHQLATEYSRGNDVIWLPTRKALDRVKRILAAPTQCGEAIVHEAKDLSSNGKARG